jgi:hypothetical protein
VEAINPSLATADQAITVRITGGGLASGTSAEDRVRVTIAEPSFNAPDQVSADQDHAAASLVLGPITDDLPDLLQFFTNKSVEFSLQYRPTPASNTWIDLTLDTEDLQGFAAAYLFDEFDLFNGTQPTIHSELRFAASWQGLKFSHIADLRPGAPAKISALPNNMEFNFGGRATAQVTAHILDKRNNPVLAGWPVSWIRGENPLGTVTGDAVTDEGGYASVTLVSPWAIAPGIHPMEVYLVCGSLVEKIRDERARGYTGHVLFGERPER